MDPTSTTSQVGTALLRICAGIVGAGIIAGVTYAAVTAIGGINAPTAPLLVAHAVGLVVGAMCIGLAVKSRRFVVAAGLILTLFAGEAYTLMNTGERELEAREAKQVPARATMERRKALSVEIAKGEAALAALTTSRRLADALIVQRQIADGAMSTSAQQGCGKYCTKTLAESAAGAQREVDAARAALDGERKTIMAGIEADKAALAAIPTVAALSPLAARVNVADWKLDLLRAGLLTLSANGLGAFLLVFAAHSGRRESVLGVSVSTVSEPKGLTFERPLTEKEIEEIKELDREIKQVLEALVSSGRPICNDELAKLICVGKSEASKQNQKAHAAGMIDKRQVGKFVYMEPTEEGLKAIERVGRGHLRLVDKAA